MGNIRETVRQVGQRLENNKKAVILSGVLTAGTAVALAGCDRIVGSKTEPTNPGQGTSQPENNDNKLSKQATITAKELEDLKKQIANGAQNKGDTESQKTPEQKTGLDTIKPVAVPKSLDDPDMKSHALQDDTQKGVWFHPLHKPELWVTPKWDGAWSWGVSLMHQMDGAHLESFGNSGETVIQVDEGLDSATIIVGAMTSDSYKGQRVIDDYKWGTRGKARVQNKDLAVGMWIRTQPGAEITVINPDTGEAVVKDGKEVKITANDRGDAGIILPDKGRVAAKWRVTDPTKGTFESRVWFGPDDDPQSDQRINKVDARQLAAK